MIRYVFFFAPIALTLLRCWFERGEDPKFTGEKLGYRS